MRTQISMFVLFLFVLIGMVFAGTYNVQNSDLWDNAPPYMVDGVGAVTPAQAAYANLIFDTNAASITVWETTDIMNDYPQWASIGLRVDGNNILKYYPSAGAYRSPFNIYYNNNSSNGQYSFNYTFGTSGTHHVELIAGLQSDPSNLHHVKGTYINRVDYPTGASFSIVSPSDRPILWYVDSIGVGASADNPEYEGVTQLLHYGVTGTDGKFYKYPVAVDGWGYRALADNSATDADINALAVHFTKYNPSALYLEVADNDQRLNNSNFGTSYAKLVDDFHLLMPNTPIFCQPAIPGNSGSWWSNQVRTVCNHTARPYTTLIESSSWSIGLSSDNVHPTTDGHLSYAEYVAPLLAALLTPPTKLSVTLAGVGSGSITGPSNLNCVSGTCFVLLTANSIATITANPAADSNFTGWSGACNGNSRTCTLTMDSNKSVTGTFAKLSLSKPTITSQPTNQSGVVNGSATFSVSATGNPTPLYQWRRGQVPISGATSQSYAIPSLVSGDNGAIFDVNVYNSQGSTVSSPATLSVSAVDSSLLGWWKFDELSGSTAADSSGHTNSGTLNNSPSFVLGKTGFGNALQFVAASNQYVSLAGVNLGSSYSIAAWENVASGTSTSIWQTIVAESGSNTLQLYNGKLDLSYGGEHLSNTGVPFGQWVHVAAVNTSGTVTLYINGVADSAVITGIPAMNVKYIGGFDVQDALNGSLDDVMVYNRALSPSEINDLYNGTTQPPANNPPSVSIISPTQGQVFSSAPASFDVNVNATDLDFGDAIANVKFYLDGSLLSTDATAPYSARVNNLASGSYSITATATDLEGAINSQTINVTVNSAAGSNFHPADTGRNWDINGQEYAWYGACFKSPAICASGQGPVTNVDSSMYFNASNIWNIAPQTYTNLAGSTCPPNHPSTCWTPGSTQTSGAINPGEICNDTNLNGYSCAGSFAGYTGGTLRCDSNRKGFDVSGCTQGTVRTASSCNFTDVNAKVSEASAGDIVQIPSCPSGAVWNQPLTITKSIWLRGAGVNLNAVKSSSGDLTVISNNAGGNAVISISPTVDAPVRITGIYFKLNDWAVYNGIFIGGKSTHFRIDHCKFYRGKHVLDFGGWNNGVVDHCTFIDPNIAVFAADVEAGDVKAGDHSWMRPIAPGSIDSVVIEDNLFYGDDEVVYNFSDNQILYGQNGGRATLRYNTFTDVGAIGIAFIDSHPGTATYRSQPLFEIYNNQVDQAHLNPSGQFIDFRGGTMIMHDNNMNAGTSYSGAPIVLWNEQNVDVVDKSYFWNNYFNGAIVSGPLASNGTYPYTGQMDVNYWMHAPQSGQVFYPYTPLVYPHPLVAN